MNRTACKLLTGVLVLQGLILAAAWRGDGATRAYGEIPDGGVADRRQTVEELRNLNAKMDKLLALLESGRLQVKAVPADDNKAGR